MLRTLRLDNFKGFDKPTSIPLAPLTLIYGQNSAGKSSVLQSLLLLKQSVGDERTQQLFAQPRLVTQGNLTDLGTFLGIVHGHDPRSTLRIGFDCDSDLRLVDGPTLQLDARSLQSVRVDLGFRQHKTEARSAQQVEAELGLADRPSLRFRVAPTGGASSPVGNRRMTLDRGSQRHAGPLVEWVLDQLRVSAHGTKALSRLPTRDSLRKALKSKEFRTQWADSAPWNVIGFFPDTIGPEHLRRRRRAEIRRLPSTKYLSCRSRPAPRRHSQHFSNSVISVPSERRRVVSTRCPARRGVRSERPVSTRRHCSRKIANCSSVSIPGWVALGSRTASRSKM